MLSDKKICELVDIAEYGYTDTLQNKTLSDYNAQLAELLLDAHDDAIDYSEGLNGNGNGYDEYNECLEHYVNYALADMCINDHDCHHIIKVMGSLSYYDKDTDIYAVAYHSLWLAITKLRY